MRRGISLTSATGAAARAVPGGVAGSEAGGPGPDDLGAGGIVYADVIKEIDGSGTVTWSWRAAEHLDPALYPLQPHYRREHWPLINGVCPLADGTVAASLRSVSKPGMCAPARHVAARPAAPT